MAAINQQSSKGKTDCKEAGVGKYKGKINTETQENRRTEGVQEKCYHR